MYIYILYYASKYLLLSKIDQSDRSYIYVSYNIYFYYYNITIIIYLYLLLLLNTCMYIARIVLIILIIEEL